VTKHVTLFEMSPRDGLQNESHPVSTANKIKLVDFLSEAGLSKIETASFVNPKVVPQMADGAEVLAGINRRTGVRYTALTPNMRGFEAALLAKPDEIAVFAAASEGFSKANINCTIEESLARKALREMGCYQISLGDTIGSGTPERISAMLKAVLTVVPAEELAGHFHDTKGFALGNVSASLDLGLRVFDACNIRQIAKDRAMSTLEINKDPRGVAYVALNRPEKRNALSAEMIHDLTEMARTLGTDPETRAIVLKGNGKTFCAGGDLAWMKQQINADRATRMKEARKLAEMLKALNEMPKPLIGQIHGAAMGGGVGMACVCDMARRVFMSSRIFGASEAATLGVVARTVKPMDLEQAVEEEVAPYLTVASEAVGAAKALARHLGPKIDDATIDETIKRLADTWEGEEAKLGIEAFLTKTKAPWA